MKPTFSKEDAKVQEEQGQHEKMQSSNRKLLVRAAISLTSVVVIAGLVLGAVYFGMFMKKEHMKETWVQYHDTAGRLVNQQITVTLTEEDYETNTVRAIYDFHSMIVTYKFTEDPTGNCYVSKLDQSEVDTPTKVYSNLTEEWKTDQMAPRMKQVERTTIDVPLEILSPRAKDMCKFSNVYWMILHEAADQNGTHVEKRYASLDASYCCCRCGYCCTCNVAFGNLLTLF